MAPLPSEERVNTSDSCVLRFSSSVHGPINPFKMGKTWGNLAKLSGITYFRISPHEQKAFGGMIKHGVPNLVRRFNGSVLRVAPWFLGSYMIMEWAEEEFKESHRKNPKDYENDT
ncbi:ubiquinol-cytochrome c reductase ubiquinone-binding protein isoform X2 [Calliopsis andreniformis]|uniref:ubiquinol-cytochrome c reductase ubiquinone-binding protein isoform X2 n=1 Tax=Calliopsis andreniformis TaxID=337506 RepID=UPI003FCCF4F7